MSRWECVSERADNVAEDKVGWLNIANRIVQAENMEATSIQLQVGSHLT